MSLTPYDSYSSFDQMRKEMERLFDARLPSLFQIGGGAHSPRMDVMETDKEIIVQCDIPGLERKEDVNIHIDKHLVTIHGSIEKKHEVEEQQIIRQERVVGKFSRSISLPAHVDPNQVHASYRNGVLEIRMQKEPKNQHTRIDVEFH